MLFDVGVGRCPGSDGAVWRRGDAGRARPALGGALRCGVEHVRPDRDDGLVDQCSDVDAASLERMNVPIGRPIANTVCRVLDAAGGLAPVGVPGRAVHRRRRRGPRLPRPPGADRGAVRGRPVRCRRGGCIAPGTWRGGCPTARSSSSAGSTSRSRCAATASSSARSNPRCAAHVAVADAVVVADGSGSRRPTARLRRRRGRRRPADSRRAARLAPAAPPRLHDPVAASSRSTRSRSPPTARSTATRCPARGGDQSRRPSTSPRAATSSGSWPGSSPRPSASSASAPTTTSSSSAATRCHATSVLAKIEATFGVDDRAAQLLPGTDRGRHRRHAYPRSVDQLAAVERVAELRVRLASMSPTRSRRCSRRERAGRDTSRR